VLTCIELSRVFPTLPVNAAFVTGKILPVHSIPWLAMEPHGGRREQGFRFRGDSEPSPCEGANGIVLHALFMLRERKQ